MTRKPIREKRWMIWSPILGLRVGTYRDKTYAKVLFDSSLNAGGRLIQVEIREVVKKRKARKR